MLSIEGGTMVHGLTNSLISIQILLVSLSDGGGKIKQQQQQQRLIPLGGIGYMDQLPP